MFLDDLSIRDIRQRYSETFMRYDNKVIYCRGFIGREADKASKSKISGILMDKNGILNEEIQDLFVGDLVDLVRPVPKWIRVNGHGVYFSYPQVRQYHRGLCANNVYLFCPTSRMDLVTTAYHIYNTPEHDEEFRLVNPRYLIDLVEDDGVAMFRNNLAILMREGKLLIFFRMYLIGQLLDAGEVVLREPLFEQELREAMPHINIRLAPNWNLGIDPQSFAELIMRAADGRIPQPNRRPGQNLGQVLREQLNQPVRPEDWDEDIRDDPDEPDEPQQDNNVMRIIIDDDIAPNPPVFDQLTPQELEQAIGMMDLGVDANEALRTILARRQNAR